MNRQERSKSFRDIAKTNKKALPEKQRLNKLPLREPATDAEDVGGLQGWIQLDIISFAAPEITHVREKIVDLVNVGIHRAEFRQRNVNVGMLDAGRIEIHHDQDDVVS